MIRIFGHYIPSSLALLALFEFLVVFAAFYVGIEIRFTESSLNQAQLHTFYIKATVFSVTIFLSMVATGLYSRSARENFIRILVKLGLSFLLGFIVLIMLFYVAPNWFVGRGVFALSMLIAFAGVIFVRYLYSIIVDAKLLNSRVLVVGAGNLAQQLQVLKRKSDWRGITLVGFVPLSGEQTQISEDNLVLSELTLPRIVNDYAIDELIIAVEEERKNYPVDELIDCKMQGIEVTEISAFFEKRTGKIQIDTLHPNRFIFIEGFQQNLPRIIVKRLVDIILSLLIMLLTIPVYPLFFLLIKKESGWSAPVFYTQVRVGQQEKQFVIYKFRSMVVDAEKQGAQWASKNDNRVTKIGNIMRKTRLDELPQLVNVLKGDMSFVGPRPERPEFVERLAESIPYYRMRHRVKPGITGWAQVCYPYGDDVKDAKEKLQFDLYYIKNYSVFLDLTILVQTTQVILWQKGAR